MYDLKEITLLDYIWVYFFKYIKEAIFQIGKNILFQSPLLNLLI